LYNLLTRARTLFRVAGASLSLGKRMYH